MSDSRRPPRVVLDTNLVLSALVFGGGTPGALRHSWHQGHFQPLVSSPTAAELLRALAYPKFELSSPEQEELLADYLPWCETVSIPEPPPTTLWLAATRPINRSCTWPWPARLTSLLPATPIC